ncbi:MAG: acetyl-CoA carboxylase biotin carboxyl carrier protein subunit, partial [Flavobacteriaceae bacterium]
MAYNVTINNNYEFDITQDDISKIDVVKTSKNKFHILKKNVSYKAEILKKDFNNKRYSVNVNNNNYDISIANDLDLLIKKMGFTVGSTKHIDTIKAPMPGLILDISVKSGEEVKEDQQLLILEAMKMENIIVSPRDGKIKSISVSKGDAIEKGQLLIEF